MKNNKTNKSSKGGAGASAGGNAVITDSRFKYAQEDPKFKMYRRKDTAVKLDSRFENLMKSNSSFTSDAPIDQYGRKIVKNVVDKSIKKTYVLEDEKDKKDIEKVDKVKKGVEKKVEKKVQPQPTKNQKSKKVESSEEEEEEEGEEEEEEEESINSDVDTEEKVIEYGGFEYNSDTESSDAEEFKGDEVDSEDEQGMEEEEYVPRGDASKRFAVLNCDWDNITSKDLFVLLNSFVPTGGHIERVTIYPSDFGLEQMAKEKSLGPNKDIWNDGTNNNNKKAASSLASEKDTSITFDKSEDAESLDGKGFNLEKLRQYELSKLKYYYAVVECNSVQTADKIYDECEGMEIEDTANVLDLRFIPDEQVFKNTPRDTCNELPVSAPGFTFQTSILKGTAVDFTWDVDKTRKKLLTKNFSKSEAREEDLRAYLAEPSSDDDSDESDDGEPATDKNSKRLKLRNKYKSLLLDNEDEEEKDDIKITFNSAFSDVSNNKSNDDDDDDSQDEDDLTVKFSDQEVDSSSEEEQDDDRDNQQEDGSEEGSDSEADDESSDYDSEEDDDKLEDGEDAPDWAKDLKSDEEDDTVQEMVINTNLNSVGKKLLKEKEKRENGNVWSDYLQEKKDKKAQKKREKRVEIERLIKEKEDKEKASKKNKQKGKLTEEEKKEKAELELLLMDDDITKAKGFTKKQMERDHKMNTIDPIERKKLEKKLKKKNQKLQLNDDKNLLDLQGFKMDTKDGRFGKIYSSSDFALDPTDSKFKRTTGMVEILTEKKNRRQVEKENEEKEILERRKNNTNNTNNTNNNNTNNNTTTSTKSSLSEMAQNIKRKAEEQKNQLNSKKFKK